MSVAVVGWISSPQRRELAARIPARIQTRSCRSRLIITMQHIHSEGPQLHQSSQNSGVYAGTGPEERLQSRLQLSYLQRDTNAARLAVAAAPRKANRAGVRVPATRRTTLRRDRQK